MLDDDDAARIAQLEDRIEELEDQVAELRKLHDTLRDWAMTWGPRLT